MPILSAKAYRQASRKRITPRYTNKYFSVWNVSIIILVVSLGLWLWSLISNPQTMPIHSVKINGIYSHVDKQALQETILPFLKKGFINLNSDDLIKALQQLPWVDNVIISRKWPDQVLIQLTEFSPVAYWNSQGFLDTKGSVFTINDKVFLNEIPQLKGPEGQQQAVWQNYQQMSAQLAPLGLKITQLAVSNRHSWELQLNNGIKLLLGRLDPQLRLQRLINIYAQVIGSRASDIDYIDMRYVNGIAVGAKVREHS